MINHRKFLRAPVFRDGLLSSGDSGEKINNIQVKNISEGGALISSTFELDRLSEFSLILELSELPDIKQLWLSSQAIANHDDISCDFLRVKSCSLGELREFKQGVFTYALVFNNLTIEANKKIQSYINESKKLVEYLMSVETQGKPDDTSKAFIVASNLVDWFDNSLDMTDQVKSFYQDLSWSYLG